MCPAVPVRILDVSRRARWIERMAWLSPPVLLGSVDVFRWDLLPPTGGTSWLPKNDLSVSHSDRAVNRPERGFIPLLKDVGFRRDDSL